MNKADRIAIAITGVVGIFSLLVITTGNHSDKEIGGWIIVGIVAYWGYRFIKNDISFYKVEEKE